MDWGMLAQAGLWGIVAASSLLLGALLGVLLRLPQRVVAALMAYGSGVLIAALCFEQIPEALRLGGLAPTLWGLLAGGLCFVAANEWLERQERHQRGREAGGQTHMAGLLIAAGAFLDGIPESVGLGLGLLDGGQVSLMLLVAIFLSNLPEGLASAAGLCAEGRSRRYVFRLWGGIVLLSGIAAMAGPGLFAGLSSQWLAVALGFSAGAVLCMLVDAMIPEAFAETHALTGLITLTGFMTALALDKAI
jgi:ZIP family zinc transporter